MRQEESETENHEIHGQQIYSQQSAGKRLAGSGDMFYGLGGLHGSYDARKRADHSGHGAGEHSGIFLRAEEFVESGVSRSPRYELPLESGYSSDATRLSKTAAHFGGHELCGGIVASVDYEVVVPEEALGIVASYHTVDFHYLHIRVHSPQTPGENSRFAFAHLRGGVHYLSLQVADVDSVEVGYGKSADSGSAQVG